MHGYERGEDVFARLYICLKRENLVVTTIMTLNSTLNYNRSCLHYISLTIIPPYLSSKSPKMRPLYTDNKRIESTNVHQNAVTVADAMPQKSKTILEPLKRRG
jgi:hypothetical protein